MDSVINGKKPEVDLAFGMIQRDSMERVERSKEAMRNSAIDKPSGDGEVYGVSLTPKTWAISLSVFSDTNFEVQRGVKVSPGSSRIHEMIKNWEDDKSGEWAFPAYPTSFIVAANTTIEFKGETRAIEELWRASGESVGYGPWSVSCSAAAEQTRVDSTPTGCNIKFGAPQIIAWVNQITPSLPR
ncbi:hypothetical protein FGADI_10615 [Fusarium gaditjirri]|uniref:Uncharacterized protein n=1 Tax=Fusarium gaditjirri TaxID=282569 RepID=A0A8H4SX99_9HYPO|nr:hypothetical protein FGADI_10615 [Fusarium gaditjirri]